MRTPKSDGLESPPRTARSVPSEDRTGNRTEPRTDGGGLTKPCPRCDGAGEFVEVERGGRVEAVKGVEALDRIRDGDWTYHGERECTNCSGYGHVDRVTGEI